MCLVCRFETSIRKRFMLIGCTDDRCKRNMAHPSKSGCNMIAHSYKSNENKHFIFNVGFVGKSCFDIAHDNKSVRVFVKTTNSELRQRKTTWRGHIMYDIIWKQYKLIADGQIYSNITCAEHETKEDAYDKEDNSDVQ